MKKIYVTFIILMLAAVCGTSFAAKRDLEPLTIPLSETKEYSINSLDKAVSLNPDIAIVKKVSESIYSVTGVGNGSTFIIFWKQSGEKTALKVTVKPAAAVADDEGSHGSQNDDQSLKIGYNFFTYNGASVSQYSFNQWSYSGLFHQLTFTGKTPLGTTNSMVQYEGYNNRYGFTKLALNFKTDKYYFNFGDSFTNFSDITLPFLNYQGLYFNLTPNNVVDLTVAGGDTANGLWGKTVWDDSRPKQTFGAAKLTVKPLKNFSFNLTAVSSTQEALGMGSNIMALGALYRPFDRLTLQGETATSGGGKAWWSEAVYNGDNMFFKGTYRNVGPDYITPSDSVNWRGTEGFFLSGSYKPLSFAEIGASADRYINSYLQGSSSTFYNKNLRGNLRLIMGPQTTFTYSPWIEDKRGYPSGGIGEGSTTQISHDFKLVVPNTVYARYEPTKFTDSGSAEADYLNESTLLGIRMGISDALSFNVEKGWETKTLFFNLSQENINYIRMMLNYNSKIGRTPFYSTINSQYYSSYSTDGTGLNEMWADVELGYEITDRAKAYVRGKIGDYRGIGASTVDRAENHINVGFNYVFDTKSQWQGLSYVSGYVFIDTNGDGIRNENEKGIPGARVIVGNRITTTDKTGMYIIRSITAAPTRISLDQNSISSGYILTSPNPVEIDTRTTQSADFGVMGQPSVRGTIYFDANSNGIYDVSDVPMPSVKITYDGGSVVTDANGNYEIFGLKEGPQNIYLDVASIPAEYNAAGKTSAIITVKKGACAYADFKLGMPKAIYGYIYYDKNANGRKDYGEKGFHGIEVRLNGNTTVTSPDGMYVFKNVDYGVNKLTVAKTTIPSGYFMPDKTLAKYVNVKRGGKSAYEVNFRLKK